MQFNVNSNVVKMLDLIDRSDDLKRMAWWLVRTGCAVVLIHAVRWW